MNASLAQPVPPVPHRPSSTVVSAPAVFDSARESARIDRIRHRYQTGPAVISIQRARYYTDSWRKTEKANLPVAARVATAMREVYRRVEYHLDPDDRIAGCWSEHFLGCPFSIERGEYNNVLRNELTLARLLAFRARSMARGLVYMARKGVLGQFARNSRIASANGQAPLDMGLQTMSRREINPYRISDADRRELLGDLLPYWKGRSLTDRLEAETMRAGLYSRDMVDFVMAVPGLTSRQVVMLSTAATIATIQGHVILDYGPVLEQGLDAMRRQVRDLLADAADPSRRDFLTSVDIALEGVDIFARRTLERVQVELERAVNADDRNRLAALAERCARVPFQPPRGFAEAVQALWTVKTAIELALPINLQCFGRLDQILDPYYRRDLETGRETPDTARAILEELLLKLMSQNIRPESNVLGRFYHRFLGSTPVTLAGVKADGSDATCALTYLFIEAAERSRAVTNVSVRVARSTPTEVLERVAEAVARGAANLSLFNDELHIKAMEKRGFATVDARDYAIMGCVEATCPGKTGSMSASALLLSRLLDLTLRNGDSATLAGVIAGEGLPTGTSESFRTFDALLEALGRQADRFLERIVAASNLRDRLYSELLPAPYISAFMEGCLASGKDVVDGGARYNLSGISMINSAANLIDSLLAIKTLVFDQRRFDLPRIVRALDADYREDPELLKAVRSLPGKWGNGDPDTDRLAHAVMKRLFSATYGKVNYRGGPFVVYLISMITHTIDGRLSIATPDGRRAATPYAASGNPYNVERSGVTAALRSIAGLPHEDAMGCAVNMKFHPTGIGRTAEARAKWAALLRAYFEMGGPQLQPMGVSRETLRAAQEDPSAHRDLIIKVGGYSAYFTDLGREIQEEIIARTEHP